tara:strand:+ start:357 stop:536 length:180 start_codon:yes stop_codon:yes gene_type:complete
MKNFTITMASGMKFGGQYRSESHARQNFSGNVIKVEQRALLTSEEVEEMDREKDSHRSH